jgi:hypothetical protein
MAVLSLNLIIGTAPGLTGTVRGQEVLPSEYQMKAAYLYNFAKFVEWPVKALPADNSDLVIGILGDDPFGNALESTVKDKKIEGHPLRIRLYKSPKEARACHILFINSAEKKRWQEIIDALAGSNVLTVSEDWARFTTDGGMIYFFMDGRKVCFDINDEAAQKAGLKISSKLMVLRKKPAA